jgi:hypothetical protein
LEADLPVDIGTFAKARLTLCVGMETPFAIDLQTTAKAGVFVEAALTIDGKLGHTAIIELDASIDGAMVTDTRIGLDLDLISPLGVDICASLEVGMFAKAGLTVSLAEPTAILMLKVAVDLGVFTEAGLGLDIGLLEASFFECGVGLNLRMFGDLGGKLTIQSEAAFAIDIGRTADLCVIAEGCGGFEICAAELIVNKAEGAFEAGITDLCFAGDIGAQIASSIHGNLCAHSGVAVDLVIDIDVSRGTSITVKNLTLQTGILVLSEASFSA